MTFLASTSVHSSPRLPLLTAVLLLTLMPRLSAAAVPTAGQSRCLTALANAETTMAKAASARMVNCMTNVGKGRLPSASADQCLATETPAMRTARLKGAAAVAKVCTNAKADFGPNSAEAVSDALAKIVDGQRLFGTNLGSTLQSAASNRAAAQCQFTLAKQLTSLATAEFAEYRRCTANKLKQNKAASAGDLESCVGTDSGNLSKAKLLAEKRIAAACAGVPTTAYPGQCANASSTGELVACVSAEAHCGASTAVNTADNLAAACHQYANGVATHYCGTRPENTQSVARQWNEEILSAIRIDNPRPPVHARNLFHLSVAMYDAWAAYDNHARGYLSAEHPQSANSESDRDIAISFAAYRILAQRYSSKLSLGAATSQFKFAQRMNQLGFDPGFTDTLGDTPAAVGNRIAAAVLAFGMSDGSHEFKNYSDPTYEPVNQPLIVKEPDIHLTDPRCEKNEPECDPIYQYGPNRWQPLALDLIVSQNGIPLPDKTQTAIGSHWGDVIPFAMYRVPPGQLYHLLESPPALGGATQTTLINQAMEVIRLSSQLSPDDPTTIDISPGALGNNELGTNNGTGLPQNPITQASYAPEPTLRADYGRVLAEFWADGPTSETPPGHWNVIANHVADTPGFEHKLEGTTATKNRLEWDVKTYFALNAAEHDAAIAAWGAKRFYDSARPISIIRYLAKQHSLPLEPGLVEEITAESAGTGGKHAHLVTDSAGGQIGDIAIFNWPGSPTDPKTQTAGVRWVLGKAWVPYQRRTFVTPAFPAYISGHSTFSRAAAEVLTQITGSEFFPGGLTEYVIHKDTLIHEKGPTADVHLQWARYFDASDQSGRSRLWGGIHIEADDFEGRKVGHQVGLDAYGLARKYFTGNFAP